MGERTRVRGTERTEEVARVCEITASPATGHTSHTGHLSCTNIEQDFCLFFCFIFMEIFHHYLMANRGGNQMVLQQ